MSDAPTEVTHAKPRNRWRTAGFVLFALLAVLVLALVYAGVTISQLNADNENLTSERDSLSGEVESKSLALLRASNDAAEWEASSDAWRLCGQSVLEVAQALVEDDVFGGLAEMGEATARCESARVAEVTASGSGWA